MKFRFTTAFALFVAWLTLAASAWAAASESATSWTPQHTWVFAVGVLKWKSSELSGFSTKNRRDAQLVDEFRKQGVPDSHIIYLPNEKATLSNVMSGLNETLTKVPAGDTLVFYYCGHGWLDDAGNGYFANYDAGDTNDTCLSAQQIADTICSKFQGKLIVLADCCRSGTLANALHRNGKLQSWAVFTSAIAQQDSTSNWTFTQSVLDSLRGHRFADTDGNGTITLGELGNYVRHEMKDLENQRATAAFGDAMPQEAAFSAVRFKDEPVPTNVEVKYEGDWWKAKQLSVKGDQAKIHWITIGWDGADDDTWVPLSDVRPLKQKAASTTVSNAKTDTGLKLSIGDQVQVLWEGKYYPAVVQKIDGSKYFIHYDGYESNWDEWVGSNRIK